MIEINVGDKIGVLTVIQELPMLHWKNVSVRNYLCRCECGKERIFHKYNIYKYTECKCKHRLSDKEVKRRKLECTKAHQKLLQEKGICIFCGKNKAVEGKTRCSECIERQRLNAKKEC